MRKGGEGRGRTRHDELQETKQVIFFLGIHHLHTPMEEGALGNGRDTKARMACNDRDTVNSVASSMQIRSIPLNSDAPICRGDRDDARIPSPRQQ